MKFSPIVAVALATSALPLAAVAQPAAAWNGTYAYNEPQGRDAAGAGASIFVDHRLTISPNGCRLTAQGYQTNTTIRCAAKASGDRLDVSFVSFGDGKLTNQYGVKLYNVGQPLVSLRRQAGGLTTTWQGYKPGLEAHEKPGAYFKKAS